ncbi:unnamed protein product, partial [Polarella glacialis]
FIHAPCNRWIIKLAMEGREKRDSRLAKIGQGSMEVQAIFGEKKLTGRRERFAETLFRSCGLGTVQGATMLLAATTASLRGAVAGEDWDTSGAACVAVGVSYRSNVTGKPSAISTAAASRNDVVARSHKAMSEIQREKTVRSSIRKSDVGRRPGEAELDKAPVVDSKALAAEIDSVAATLRNLLNNE